MISMSVRLSCVLSVCVTFVVFTDCESCTRPISTNPTSMESGEYEITLGTCFLACRLELDAVTGLLWISWCVLRGADSFSVFFSRFFFLRTHTACSKYEAASCLIYLSTSNSHGVCFYKRKSTSEAWDAVAWKDSRLIAPLIKYPSANQSA